MVLASYVDIFIILSCNLQTPQNMAIANSYLNVSYF